MRTKQFNKFILIVVLLVVVAVFGTSIFYASQLERIVEEIIIAPYPQTTNLDYEIPNNNLNVFVNQNGYEIGNDMVVMFQGSLIPDTFEVVDYNTKQVVYEGEVLTISNGTIENVRVGDFKELAKEGDYYVQADYIGQSYPFQIHNKVREDLFKSVYYAIVEQLLLEDDLLEQVKLATIVLVAYEFYPMNFTDDTGIAESGNKIPDILDTLKNITIKIEEKIALGVDLEANDEFKLVGFLAKYGKLYESYDRTEGTRYTKLAQTMWQDIVYDTEEELMSRYFAASELYHSLGSSQYHNIIKEYKITEFTAYDKESIYKLYGDLTYLMTNNPIDINYCDALMEERIERALSIATQVKTMDNLSLGNNKEQSLYNSFELIIIIQVLVSHEYRNMLEDQLTYFGGVNSDGINYLNEINADPFFLLMMCDIIT